MLCELITRTGDGSSSLRALAGVANDKGPIRAQSLFSSLISGAETIAALTASGLDTPQRFPLMRSSANSFVALSISPAKTGQEFIVQAGCSTDSGNFAYSRAHVSRMGSETVTVIDTSTLVLFPSRANGTTTSAGSGSTAAGNNGTPATSTGASTAAAAPPGRMAFPQAKGTQQSTFAAAAAHTPALQLPSGACVSCLAACPAADADASADNALARCWRGCCPGAEMTRASGLYATLATLNPSIAAGARPSPATAAAVVNALSVRPHAPHLTAASHTREMVAMAVTGRAQTQPAAPPDDNTMAATATAQRMVAAGQDALTAQRMAAGQSAPSAPAALTTRDVVRAVETLANTLTPHAYAQGVPSAASANGNLPASTNMHTIVNAGAAGATAVPPTTMNMPTVPGTPGGATGAVNPTPDFPAVMDLPTFPASADVPSPTSTSLLPTTMPTTLPSITSMLPGGPDPQGGSGAFPTMPTQNLPSLMQPSPSSTSQPSPTQPSPTQLLDMLPAQTRPASTSPNANQPVTGLPSGNSPNNFPIPNLASGGPSPAPFAVGKVANVLGAGRTARAGTSTASVFASVSPWPDASVVLPMAVEARDHTSG